MPPHLFIAPEQATEIEGHDPDSDAKALVVGTRFAGRQAYRIAVVGNARPLAEGG